VWEGARTAKGLAEWLDGRLDDGLMIYEGLSWRYPT
jgi:hypothetical protein